MVKKQKLPASNRQETNEDATKKRERFGFTIEKDIKLLRTALSINPWQLGAEKWNEVANDLKKSFSFNLTHRTAKNRVELLVQQLKRQELKNKTGTEEQQTERGELLQQVIALQEESEAAINTEVGPESPIYIPSDAEKESAASGSDVEDLTLAKKPASQIRKERDEADKIRNDALHSLKRNLADSPVKSRRVRRRFNEEELIFDKHTHDLEMEERRMTLEEKKQATMTDLENFKLLLEEKKEERLKENLKQNHEIALAQLNLQKMMCELVTAVTQVLKKD